MSVCAKINQNQTFNCSDLQEFTPGYEATLTILNYDDLASITSGTASTLITGITKKTSAQAYQFGVGKGRNVTVTLSTVDNESYKSTTQVINFPALVKTQADLENLELLKNSEAIMILQKKQKGSTGDTKYWVFGRNGGGNYTLDLVEQAGSEENNAGIYQITFTATKQLLPSILFDTDEVTTDAIITALITP